MAEAGAFRTVLGSLHTHRGFQRLLAVAPDEVVELEDRIRGLEAQTAAAESAVAGARGEAEREAATVAKIQQDANGLLEEARWVADGARGSAALLRGPVVCLMASCLAGDDGVGRTYRPAPAPPGRSCRTAKRC